jgi:hypothetical protein
MHITSDSSYAFFSRSSETLGSAIVLGQICVLALCVARTLADLHRGPLGPEGGVALALALTVGASLARKALRFTVRSMAHALKGNHGSAAPALAPVIDLSSVRTTRRGKNACVR